MVDLNKIVIANNSNGEKWIRNGDKSLKSNWTEYDSKNNKTASG